MRVHDVVRMMKEVVEAKLTLIDKEGSARLARSHFISSD